METRTILRLGRRDLRYIASGGVCILIKAARPGGPRVLGVAASADISRAATLREDDFGSKLRLGPDEALVVLETCPLRRARLAAAFRAVLLEPQAAWRRALTDGG
jgi:hypothetical protein